MTYLDALVLGAEIELRGEIVQRESRDWGALSVEGVEVQGREVQQHLRGGEWWHVAAID